MAARRKAAPPQPGANPERGEDTLTLQGVAYRLRPSHEANLAIEKQTKQSLIQLCNLGQCGGLTFEQLGVIAAEWIKAGAEDESTRHVGAPAIASLIQEAGQLPVTLKISMVLNEAITGGRDALGERMAVSG